MNRLFYTITIIIFSTLIFSCKSNTTPNNLSSEKSSRLEQLSKENAINDLEIKTNDSIPSRAIGVKKQPK